MTATQEASMVDTAEKTQGITLTERAAEQIQAALAKRGAGEGIRVGVQESGCSGLSYKLEYVDEPHPEDHVYEAFGAKVFVHPEVLPIIDGTEMDYVSEGLQAMFQFNNPNATAECGCGESFTVN
jgi:iron-sulfur cluster assembly protein